VAASAASVGSEGAVAHDCPACGTPLPSVPALRGQDRQHGVPGEFAVVICGDCGAGLTLPVVREDALGSLYPESYNAFGLPARPLARAAATALFRARYARNLRRPPLRALLERPPGGLLDVGGGRGDLGVVLGPRGWRVTLLDPSPHACTVARGRGVHAVCGTLSSAAHELDGPYEALVFQHSLEHVADVGADLAHARRLLVPGGLLVVTLPNFACWQRRRFGADWYHLDLPRHRAHFTPRAVATALSRAGFEVRSVSTSSSSDDLPVSLQYRRFGRRVGHPYATAAISLLAAPVTAAVDRRAGGGDFLHALAARP
jgi:SAM-dependent methyltransferase